MTNSGDDFLIKGVPAHTMVVKPCKTASQVSLDCYAPYSTQTQGESPIRPTFWKATMCLLWISYVKIGKILFPFLAKIRTKSGVISAQQLEAVLVCPSSLPIPQPGPSGRNCSSASVPVLISTAEDDSHCPRDGGWPVGIHERGTREGGQLLPTWDR